LWRWSSSWWCSTGSCTRSTGRSGSAGTIVSAASCSQSGGAGAIIGLVALGFTAVYREGFEVVLFLQNLQLRNGTGMVMEGVAIGLAATAVVGAATFWLHQKLPYRRMLILTGVLVGIVLVVMISGTAPTFSELGWIPQHPTPFTVPEWMGSWFEIYPYWETLAAQLLAAGFAIGSYFLAEELKVRRPRRQGRRPTAVRASEPPRSPAATPAGAIGGGLVGSP
jgi:high-affinity iron transporter